MYFENVHSMYVYMCQNMYMYNCHTVLVRVAVDCIAAALISGLSMECFSSLTGLPFEVCGALVASYVKDCAHV